MQWIAVTAQAEGFLYVLHLLIQYDVGIRSGDEMPFKSNS